MSGLADPNAPVGYQIASYALPVMAGLAAAVHPAGARGLAGLTSGVNTMLATREYGRRERADQEVGMRISDLLKSETGEQIPDVESYRTGMANVTGTPEGPVPAPTLTNRPQRVSDLLGKQTAGLVSALNVPGYTREAAALLASQLTPRPSFHVVKEWDPATNSYRDKVVDLSRVRPGEYVGGGKPQMTDEQFIQALQRGEQQPAIAPQGIEPAPAPTEAPAAPTTVPGAPGAAAPGGALPTAGPRGELRPGMNLSYTRTPQGEISIHAAPGALTFGQTTMRGPDGRTYVFVQSRDPKSGRTGEWVAQGEAPANEEQTRLEALATSFNVEREDPRYRTLIGRLATLPTQEPDRSVRLRELYRAYGQRGAAAAPQSGAPENAPAQPRTQAPAPSYSPTQSGVMPAPPATGGAMDDVALQQEAANIRARQAATQAGGEATATEAARYQQKYKVQELGPEAAAKLMLPDGSPVPPTWTQERAAKAGAREVSTKQREDLEAMTTARALVRSFDDMTKQLNTESTFLGAKRKGLRMYTDAGLGKNPIAATYLREREAFNGRLTKTLGGDTGTLSNQDINRITNALVGLGDTKQVRDAKMGFLNMIVESASDAKERALTGRQTFGEARSAIEQRVKDMIAGMEAKAPTARDVAKARRDARGDPQRAIQLLQQRGFNPMYEVDEESK